MPNLQERYDEAMFDFSRGDFDSAIAKLQDLLRSDPEFFDAQLSLGMAFFRKGEYASAISEGHKAERLQPKEQLVHTNLSLFYQRVGDKTKAEHHGLQARIASWRKDSAPSPESTAPSELAMAKPQAAKPPPAPHEFPDMPWKKKPPVTKA